MNTETTAVNPADSHNLSQRTSVKITESDNYSGPPVDSDDIEVTDLKPDSGGR